MRNHLLQVSPVRSAATKRRVNGHERNWIRAHKMDPDVRYLLQFPGDMPAEKARDLIARRDMLALSVVEEDADGSLVMEMMIPSTAEHTSESRRIEKLDKAAAYALFGVEAVDEACESFMFDNEDETPIAPAATEAVENTENVQSVENIESIESTKHVTATKAVETATSFETNFVAAETLVAQAESEQDACGSPMTDNKNEIEAPQTDTEPVGTTAAVEIIESVQPAEPTHNISPVETIEPAVENTPATKGGSNQPQTPTPTKQDIVDVDLHTQSDIFASVMPQRHQQITPAVPAQPLWAATPRAAFSPVGALEVDEDISAHWSPVASTPGTVKPSTAATPRPVSSPVGALEVVEDTSAHWSPVMSTPGAAPAIPFVEDDRTFLVRFMNKHQAGKTTSGGPKTPEQNDTSTTPDQNAQLSTISPSQDAPMVASTPIRDAGMSTNTPKQTGTPVFAVARAPTQAGTPVRAATSRSRAGRTPLGALDANSPSPVKARTGKRKLDADAEADAENVPEGEREGKGPEPEKSPEPSPKRRRGLRARKPAAPPTPAPINARAVRNGEKDLASLTRANTRANKGNAAWPEEVLKGFAADPMGQKWKERKEVVDAKAARAAAAVTKTDVKNVRWAETIAQYREGPPADDDEDDEDELCSATATAEQDDVFVEKEGEEEEKKAEGPAKEAPKTRAKRGRPAAAVAPKAAPKSKLPAPVSRTRATKAAKAPAAVPTKIPKVEDDKVAKRRPTRAAAQKSNLGMGLTATGTPIRRGRGRPKAD